MIDDPTFPISGSEDCHLCPGSTIRGYRVELVIGRGGQSVVYRAHRLSDGAAVALKVLRPEFAPSPEMVQRFVREAQIVQRLADPSVVSLHEYGTLADGTPFMSMELLAGLTLAEHVRTKGRLAPTRAAKILEAVCAGLDAAHRAGVVHRDLKASNVILVEDGEVPRVKLLDFGIAKLLVPEGAQAGLTARGQRLGTGLAMSPEQILGRRIDQRTDIYSLGVLAYFLLTATHPFAADDATQLEAMHLESPPPLVSASAPVAKEIDEVVLRCLEKDPARRFSSVRDFLAAVRAAVSGVEESPSSVQRAAAVQVYLDVTGPVSDALLDAAAALLLELEERLVASGAIVSVASTSVLGVFPGPDRTNDDAIRAARMLRARADEAAGIAERVLVRAHAGPVELRQRASGIEVTGGELASVDSWPVDRSTPLALSAVLAAR